MKFTKLNIDDCLLSRKIANFYEGVEYNIDDEMTTKAVNPFSIRIAYNIGGRKRTRVLREIHPRKGYTLYTLHEQNPKENEVYTYYFLGVIEDNLIENNRLKEKLKLEINAISANLRNLKKINPQTDKEKKNKALLEKKLKDLENRHYYFNKLIIDNVSVGSNYFNNITDIYFLFNNELYYCDTSKERYRYTQEQLELLLKEYVYKENARFTKLKKQIDIFEKISTETENTRKREPIPEEVKFEVWRRDEGKCVICGSRENLEFDHIIPFSKGGGNTTRNIQLLCESCNRKKSDTI